MLILIQMKQWVMQNIYYLVAASCLDSVIRIWEIDDKRQY